MDTHERELVRQESRSPQQLVDLADVCSAGGDVRGATKHYSEALTLLGDAPERAMVLRKLSECLLRAGETVEAQRTAQEASFHAGSTSLEEQAHIELQLGRVRSRLGHLAEAAAHAERASAILGNSDEHPRLMGMARQLQGSAAFRLGHVDVAMRHYQDAQQYYKRASDLPRLALVYRNIGIIHRQACNWTRALECYQVAYNLMSMEGSYQDLPVIAQSLGVIHLRMGNLTEATQHFERSYKVAKEIGDPINAALALLGKAETFCVLGDVMRARELYAEASEECLLRNYPYGAALAYIGLASIALETGRIPDAQAAYERAKDLVERRGARLDENPAKPGVDVRLLGARLLLAQGKLADALSEAQAVQEVAQNQDERLLAAKSLALQAEILRAQQRHEAAAEHMDRGAEFLERVGERVELAKIRAQQGRWEIQSPEDRTRLQGLQHLIEAADLYRTLDLPAKESTVILAITSEDIRQKAFDRATDRLARVRALRQRLERAPEIDAEIQRVNATLETALVRSAVATQESLEAQSQMERILRSARPLDEKMAEFLGVLSNTIPASAACVLNLTETEARVVGCHGVPELRPGKTFKRPAVYRSGSWPEEGRPLIFLNLGEGRQADLGPLAAGRMVGAAIAIPLGSKQKSGSLVLHVDRVAGSANPSFHQAEVASCASLARQLAGFLEEAGLRDRREFREGQGPERNIALADIVTQNKGMLSILGLVGRIASSNLTVLLQGETGTGKKLIARAIHQCSGRASAPFVTVDCASLAETILESELFGHVKGSFTGAHQDRIGLIEQANGGTVFLDEIDKTNTAIQRHFLHLLDCGEIRPVGAHAYRPLDIRVVCATSAPDLRDEVEQGRFIKDLYFRLNDISISVPALRHRKDDIPLLAEYFTEFFAQSQRKTNGGISQLAMRALTAYSWPGNVRELEKAIQAAVTMSDDGETIGTDLLPSRIGDFEEEEEEPIAPGGSSLRDQLERVERQLILRMLDENGWNKSRAAVALGLSRKGLKNKITRYRLDRRGS